MVTRAHPRNSGALPGGSDEILLVQLNHESVLQVVWAGQGQALSLLYDQDATAWLATRVPCIVGTGLAPVLPATSGFTNELYQRDFITLAP